jgi:hypothetical protein
MKFLICHAREVRRFAWFEAETEEDAIDQAIQLDIDWSDAEEWETEDNDPGEFEVRERRDT